MNPLKSNQSFQNNKNVDILQCLKTSKSPDEALNKMIASNSNIKNIMKNIQQQYPGKSLKDIAIAEANKHGMDLNQLNQIANMFGRKL